MAFNPTPRGFQTRHWRALYESPILDLTSLKRSVIDGSVFVTIDAEPWGVDTTKPADIGITLLLGFDGKVPEPLLTTLEEISQKFSTETHWICLRGREKRARNREKHRSGKEYCIEDNQIEKTISEIIDQFLYKNYGSSFQEEHSITPPLVMVGFSMVFELRILSALYPRVLQRFNSWLDLQKLAREAMRDEQENIPTPSLRETLFACGFATDVRDSQGLSTKHNAATDSLRATAVLVRLQQTEPKSLHIRGSPRKVFYANKSRAPPVPQTPGHQTWWFERPNPIELYPYIARIYHERGLKDMSKQSLQHHFAPYKPIALGINKAKTYGWVCLSSLDELEQFIQQIQESVSNGGGHWTAVSAYDPAIVPAESMQELNTRRKLEQLSMREEKQKERKSMREAIK